MKNTIKFLSIILITTGLFACKGKQGVAKDPRQAYADKVAKDMCECGKDLTETMDKMKKAVAAEDVVTVQELLPVLEAQIEEFELCFAEMEKKYPEIEDDPQNEELIMAALRRDCPKMAEVIEGEEEDTGAIDHPLQPDDKTMKISDEEYNETADLLCDCTTDMVTLQEEVSKLSEAGDTEALQAMMPRMEAAASEMEGCMATVESQYGHVMNGSKATEERLLAVMKERCPALKGMIGK